MYGAPAGDLDTSWLEPGAYVLLIEARDPLGGERAFRAVSFIRTSREGYFDPVF